MTKRRLTTIRLDKIAAVNLPCQEHATIAIIKRAPDKNAPPAIAKKTFQEALNAQLVSDKISDTFWRAFENQWTVRDAFRVALTDEIAEGGDGGDAISGFTAAMQQIATVAAELAREAASNGEPDLEAAVEDAVSKWLQTKEQPMHKYTTKAALVSAASNFVLAKASAQEMTDIVDSAVALDAVGDLPAAQTELVAAAKAKAGTSEESPALAKALRDVAILKLSPDHKAHFDTLDQDAQTAFLGKSAADQAADIEKANSADPVIYKTASGIEIRKSDGNVAVMLAKQADTDRAELAKLRGEQSGSAIEKRARVDFPNVALDTATTMLKSAAELGEDTDAGKGIVKTLKTMNDASATLFKNLGSQDGGTVTTDINKARTDFDTEVTKVAGDLKVSRAEAMSKVRADRPDLFKAAFPSNEDEDA